MPRVSKKFIQPPRGMSDLLPSDGELWLKIFNLVSKVASRYNFGFIQTPVVEVKDLFVRTTGQTSEIVQKQMFELKTKGREKLVLRPEATPSIARAYVQHGMGSWSQPVRLYYFGPMFRYERPQQGRERQFYQFGFEILGSDEPCYDALIIAIFYQILKELKVKDILVKVNSIGCRKCRKSYIKALKKYYRSKLRYVCSDCKRRYKDNPLRMLDCKNPKCQEIKKGAPNILDYLCSDCEKHFKEVLECLEALKVEYMIDPHLVRGLDYYSNTVFEIFSGKIEEEENLSVALVGGGRYNYLIEELGGKRTPAVGGGAGVERIMNIIKSQLENGGLRESKKKDQLIYLIHLGDVAKKKIVELYPILLKEGFKVREALGKESLKAQLRVADKEEARFALIIGQREVFEEVVIVKDLKTGAQEEVMLEDLVSRLKKILSKQ